MTWKQDKRNGAMRVNRYGWTLTADGPDFILEPPSRAIEWFNHYRVAVVHCDDGGGGLLVGSTNEADKIIHQWVQQEAEDERERLEALAVLDALAEPR
jgi:hypothetical protein